MFTLRTWVCRKANKSPQEQLSPQAPRTQTRPIEKETLKQRGREGERGTWILTSLKSSSLVILQSTVCKLCKIGREGGGRGGWRRRGSGSRAVASGGVGKWWWCFLYRCSRRSHHLFPAFKNGFSSTHSSLYLCFLLLFYTSRLLLSPLLYNLTGPPTWVRGPSLHPLLPHHRGKIILQGLYYVHPLSSLVRIVW